MNRPPEPSDDHARILRERARRLAHEQEQTPDGGSMQVVAFGLAHERYAFEAAFVREVHPLANLTPLPGTPPFVAGIVNVRGRILAVIDIKRFFDLPTPGITDAHQVVLLHLNDVELGILADTVVGMQSIALDALQPSLPTLTGLRADYLKGVTAERLIVLDAAHLLTDPRIIVHEEVDV